MKSQSIDTDTRPLAVVWELTRACNTDCHACWTETTDGPDPKELTTAEAKTLLDDLSDFGENLLVIFSGGNPFRRDDLRTLVSYATEQDLTVALNATGVNTLTANTLEGLQEAGLYRLAFALDGGSAEKHDEFRGVDGHFERTIERIELARSLGIPVQVNSLIGTETYEELPEIRDLLESLNVVLWNLFFPVPVTDKTPESLDPTTADAVMRWLHEASQASPFGVRTVEAPQYRRVAIQRGEIVTGVRDQFGTYAGDGIVFITDQGAVQPSRFFHQSAGNVRETSIVDLYRHADLFEQLRDRERLEGRCGACPYRDICGGSRARAFATTGNPFSPDPLCPFEPPGYDD